MSLVTNFMFVTFFLQIVSAVLNSFGVTRFGSGNDVIDLNVSF